MRSTLLALLALFTPLMVLVLVPLVARIRREGVAQPAESAVA
jgi:hypothetical protein